MPLFLRGSVLWAPRTSVKYVWPQFQSGWEGNFSTSAHNQPMKISLELVCRKKAVPHRFECYS
eukprot:6432714-Amphidinium_carterae.1